MKITSQQLRRIIKEEVTKSLKESPVPHVADVPHLGEEIRSELAFVVDLPVDAPVEDILARTDAKALRATIANLGLQWDSRQNMWVR